MGRDSGGDTHPPRTPVKPPTPRLHKQDAELTALGKQQCLRLHRRLLRARLMETIDLVVASPLRRTLGTASLVFGEGNGGKGGNASSLVFGEGKEEANGNGGKGAKRCLRPHVPPVVAVEAIREVAGASGVSVRVSVCVKHVVMVGVAWTESVPSHSKHVHIRTNAHFRDRPLQQALPALGAEGAVSARRLLRGSFSFQLLFEREWNGGNA